MGLLCSLMKRQDQPPIFHKQFDIYPIIHLLPGINEMIFAVTKQQMNVLTAIQGIAATVGSARVCLNTVTHNPSQNICMRYMP